MSSSATILLTILVFLASALYASVGHAGASGDIAAMGLLGVPVAEMKPMALVLNLFVATIGTIKFKRAGHFSWRLFWPFTIASVPLAFIGGRITLPANIYRPLVGVVLIYAAYRLLKTSRDNFEAQMPREVPLYAALAW